MKAYKPTLPKKTTITLNESVEGETIERKVERILNNNEPLTDGAPYQPIYTDRKDGVIPEYNPRTDKWDLAIDAMDKVTGEKRAKRAENHKPNKADDNNTTPNQGKPTGQTPAEPGTPGDPGGSAK
jgi:hypothetical protein